MLAERHYTLYGILVRKRDANNKYNPLAKYQPRVHPFCVNVLIYFNVLNIIKHVFFSELKFEFGFFQLIFSKTYLKLSNNYD